MLIFCINTEIQKVLIKEVTVCMNLIFNVFLIHNEQTKMSSQLDESVLQKTYHRVVRLDQMISMDVFRYA